MSFPFVVPIPDTPQPPPTGGSLNIIARANTTTPYAAGGGGGASTIGPNLVVSSITTNGGWLGGFPSGFDVAGGGQGLLIGGNNVALIGIACSTLQEVLIGGPNLQQVIIDGEQLNAMLWASGLTNVDNTDMSLNISTGQSYFNNLLPNGTFLEIQSDSVSTLGGASTCCGSLELGALPDGRSFVGAALGYSVSSLSTLVLLGDGVNISSLNVSSINGAAPGGGSAISTFNQLYTSSIGSFAPLSSDLTIVGNGANLVFDMTSGQLVDIQFQLSTSIGSGADAPTISVLDQGNSSYLMSLGAANGVALTTSISSLQVSSINGGAPALTTMLSSLFAANPSLSTIVY